MLKEINRDYLIYLRDLTSRRPYYVFECCGEKRVIHDIQFFINTLLQKNIRYIKFKDDYIYLISLDKVYLYSYGYYFKGMEKW